MTRPYIFERLLSFAAMAALGMVLTLVGGFALAQDCPSQKYKRTSQTPIVKDMVNPHPSEYDFELPMPCGGKLFLRHVCIPARSYLDDFQFNMGCEECRRKDEGFMEAKHTAAIAGAFTLEELPEAWRAKLVELGRKGDGLCPAPGDKGSKALYYFIGKYEISNWQWQTVMADDCPGWDKAFTTEDPGRRRISLGLRRWSLPDVIRNGCCKTDGVICPLFPPDVMLSFVCRLKSNGNTPPGGGI